MSKIVTPPLIRFKPKGNKYPSVFLGGSIEMGAATDWQSKTTAEIEPFTSIIYNPRRADWDSSWAQSKDNPDFNNQVHWELGMIERADYVFLHFESETKSPITLLELGIASQLKPDHTFVSCAPEFWRSGNVDIVCERYGVRLYPLLSNATDNLVDHIRKVLRG